MYCGHCGKEIKPEYKFCLHCGASVIQKESIPIKEKNKIDLKKNVVVGVTRVLICIAVASVAVLASSGINQRDKENDSSQESVQKEQQMDISGSGMEYPEMHSIWIDGYEVKIIKYIDMESMLVKLQVGSSLIQAVVPRNLEDEAYVASYYTETWNGVTETALRFTSKEKDNAILFSCTTGENLDVIFQGAVDFGKDDENTYEFESPNNGNGIIGYDTLHDIALSEYDKKSSLSGYAAVVYDSDKQMIVVAGIVVNDLDKQEISKSYLEQVAFDKIEDADFVYYAKSLPRDYSERVEGMYQKYAEIIEYPTDYLQNNYEAVAEEYADHYIWDLTDDGIPEIVFVGTQNRICIVGEKNAINLVGNQIAWSKAPGEIYVRNSMPGEITWDKYKIEVDDGDICLKLIQDNYLEFQESYVDGELVSIYKFSGTEINEEKFIEKVDELFSTDIPAPRLWSTYSYIATQKGFYRSAMCLDDELVYER